MKTTRRKFIKSGLVASTLTSIALARTTKFSPTPAEIVGPFYPVTAQKDKDFDLTHIKGRSAKALGEIIHIEGMVSDKYGTPIEDAIVDLWQANAAGRYRHPRDTNSAPLDPNFQGWAIVPSGVAGEFKFTTIMPGAYPATRNWMRPPHIHFKVNKSNYAELTTQMYFPGHELNAIDWLIQEKNAKEQQLMTATLIRKNPVTFHYQIVLEEI